MGGVGLCNLQYKMEVQQIVLLLHHLHSGTPLSHIIEIIAQLYQLWVGLQNSIFADLWPCPWVLDKWLTRI